MIFWWIIIVRVLGLALVYQQSLLPLYNSGIIQMLERTKILTNQGCKTKQIEQWQMTWEEYTCTRIKQTLSTLNSWMFCIPNGVLILWSVILIWALLYLVKRYLNDRVPVMSCTIHYLNAFSTLQRFFDISVWNEFEIVHPLTTIWKGPFQ